MNNKTIFVAVIALALCLPLSAVMAEAKKRMDCGTTSDGFHSWLKKFEKEAETKGISKSTLRSALGSVGYNSRVIHLDRNQHSMKLSFNAFYNRRVSNAMIREGRNWIASHRSLASRIEKRFGVPIEVPVSIWGLETNYGSYKGMMLPIFPSLATLAYDCRRSDFFRRNLMSALRIVQRGDMRPNEMRGAWAGEIGQTQFMAEAYYKFAVDFDGNGRRDLINSSADVVASTANYLRGYGWKQGGSWNPGTHNYNVLREWNKAEVYVRTIAKMAQLMASDAPLKGGDSSGRNWSSGRQGNSPFQFP